MTEQTVRALAAIGALRHAGALAHSNLEDGSATQASHFGSYVGWAALELYVVEDLIGARLTHCYGNTIQDPETPSGRPLRTRRPPQPRLDRLDGLRQHGRPSAGDRQRNLDAVTNS